ncbi:hypothetical protein ACQKWADRAFT_287487 [Trichoderma austrokoningii]
MLRSWSLRRLLGKGRCHNRNAYAAILQLPPDILLLISDNLALHDRFLLSHTCKTLWQVISQDWDIALSRLSFEDQMEFWVGLAYTLPNCRVCQKCCELHPIDTSDVPAAIWTMMDRCAPCSIDFSRGIEIDAYSVQHYHIQLALKLSRLGNIHQKYLAALMKPYTYTGTSSTSPLTESYAAEPRIINNRFILHEEWNRINNTSTALPLFPDDMLYLLVCPHMRMSGGPAKSRSYREQFINYAVHVNRLRQLDGSLLLKEFSLLEDGIALAYESPAQWISGSCLRCPTDFAIMVSADERKATIRAWHDFGVEGSPMDISWNVHVGDDAQPWLNAGPYLDYPHGSIRELWLEGTSHGTGISRAKMVNYLERLEANL